MSAKQLSVSGALIGFPDELENVTPMRFETWKNNER